MKSFCFKQQVLRLGWAHATGHAVTLCCFFLGLGHSAWLLLGTGVPYGPTAYVLMREKKDYWIWDATAGQRYSVHDAFCPLQRVFALVNDENVSRPYYWHGSIFAGSPLPTEHRQHAPLLCVAVAYPPVCRGSCTRTG